MFSPIVQTIMNEGVPMTYFLLGCFITFYLVKRVKKPKCYIINEFQGLKK